ncbi:MAG: phosphoadenosine phosphosulfate reductase family protein [Thermoplasmatota archaeon]
MSRVFHGRMDLHWCNICRVPLVRGGGCPKCGEKAKNISYTPPGDIRPAFLHDIQEILDLADLQWGPGAGEVLIGRDSPIVLNPCPAPDRLDEIIMDGEVIGSISFSNIRTTNYLILRKEGGLRIAGSGFKPSRGTVTVDASVVPFLLDGKNLLSPGIIRADDSINPGDEVLILDPERRIISSGSARKGSSEMVGTHGMGVKVRWAMDPDDIPSFQDRVKRDALLNRDSWKKNWDRTVSVNSPHLEAKVRRSIKFLGDLKERTELPMAVSFSGGKDSLATLYLTLESGLRPPVMFVDTGLEFPETVDHVHDLIRREGLELVEGHPVSGFFENLSKFGPPGRDFRWCCKLCKLGPTTNIIRERFPTGVLALIGQRRFESDKREKKGAVWENPWVPLQKGASPVQDWTALDVWLYIFSRNVPYNPLYEKGFQRIGCWLCPSCDMAEVSLVKETGVDRSRWETFLDQEKDSRGLPEEWLTHGFHRFKRMPPHMVRLAEEMGIDPASLRGEGKRGSEEKFLDMVKGTNDCDDGISREGILGKMVPWKRLKELINILGAVEEDRETGGISITPPGWSMKRKAIEIYPDGTLIIRGKDHGDLEGRTRALISIIQRSMGCIGCSICVSRCPHRALSIDLQGGIVKLDPHACKHCASCLGPCPAEAFMDDPFTI